VKKVVRRPSLHDANGNFGGTYLWPMRVGLHTVMTNPKATFHADSRHVFVDHNGIMYWEKGDEFRARRAHILSHFVAHFKGIHTEDVVLAEVCKAEKAFLGDRIAEIRNAKQGKLPVQEPITKRNFC